MTEVVNLREPDFVTTEHQGVVTVEARAGLQLDLENRGAFKEMVAEAVGSAACSSLVIDVSRATFMDCSNLEVVQRANKTLAEQNKPLVLDIAGPSTGIIQRLLEVTGAIDHMLVVTERQLKAPSEAKQSGALRVYSNPTPTPAGSGAARRPQLRLVQDTSEPSSG